MPLLTVEQIDEIISSATGLTVDVDLAIMDAGVDSLGMVDLANELQEAAGGGWQCPATYIADRSLNHAVAHPIFRKRSPECGVLCCRPSGRLMFDFPSSRALGKYFEGQANKSSKLFSFAPQQAHTSSGLCCIAGSSTGLPIGISQTNQQFWPFVMAGADASTQVPAERWDSSDLPPAPTVSVAPPFNICRRSAWSHRAMPNCDDVLVLRAAGGGGRRTALRRLSAGHRALRPEILQHHQGGGQDSRPHAAHCVRRRKDWTDLAKRAIESAAESVRHRLDRGYEALAAGGQTKLGLVESATGVYVGITATDYVFILEQRGIQSAFSATVRRIHATSPQLMCLAACC